MILSRTIGIDLGTTNSAVAMLGPNERDLVLGRDGQGRTTLPSCVWADPRKGVTTVGHAAHARRGTRPGPVTSIKRSMGAQVSVTLGAADKPTSSACHMAAFTAAINSGGFWAISSAIC